MFLGFVTQNVKTGYESVLWCVRGIFVLRIQYTKLEIKERWILEKMNAWWKAGHSVLLYQIQNYSLLKSLSKKQRGSLSNDSHQEFVREEKKVSDWGLRDSQGR